MMESLLRLTFVCMQDDTKIWRPMKTELDCAILQKRR